MKRAQLAEWIIEDLQEQCNYHMYGRCHSLACAKTNGCAIAHVLFGLGVPSRQDRCLATIPGRGFENVMFCQLPAGHDGSHMP